MNFLNICLLIWASFLILENIKCISYNDPLMFVKQPQQKQHLNLYVKLFFASLAWPELHVEVVLPF